MAGEARVCPNCDDEMGVHWNGPERIRPVDHTTTEFDEYTEFGWWLHKCTHCGHEEHEIATAEQ